MATQEGPQHITVHGQPAAVVVSAADYRSLKRRPARFVVFIRRSPLKSVALDLTRDRSPPRETSL